MQLRLIKTAVLLLIGFLSCAGASDPTPATNPAWTSEYPSARDMEPKRYAEYNQTLTCLARRVAGVKFNLAEAPDCRTGFSQDLYGWGVRIGFYTTWFSSLFANVFLDVADGKVDTNSITTAIDTNAIFILALEISVLKATFADHSIMRVDALILYLIGTGTTVGALSLWGHRTTLWGTKQGALAQRRSFANFGTYARLVLCFLFNLYGLWFWYAPFGSGTWRVPTCDPRCWTAYIFGTKLASGIRWFVFSFALIWEIYWGIHLVMTVLCLILPVFHHPWTTYNERFWTSVIQQKVLFNFPDRCRKLVLPIVDLLWYIFIIVLIEITLHQNRQLSTLAQASASTTPAQLVPFFIGIIGLARSIWLYFTSRYEKRWSDWTAKISKNAKNPGSSYARPPTEETELNGHSSKKNAADQRYEPS